MTNNTNKICYQRTIFNITKSKNGKRSNMALKRNIFMSYEHTLNIKDYIKNEDWGIFNKRLFSYLDYTFRARLINNQIFKFKFNKINNIIGLYNTGLYSKKNNNLLYMVFKLNNETNKKQLFALTKDPTKVNEYLMTKKEIMIKYGISEYDIPNNWNYLTKKDYINGKYLTQFNWDQIFRTILNHRTGGNSRDIILKEFEKNGIILDSKRMRQLLIKPFENATFEAINEYNNNNNNEYIRPGVFFRKNNYEIVLQMLLNISYNNKIIKFACVIEKDNNKYKFVKILNMEMAYKNARLIKQVPKSWTFIEEDAREYNNYYSNKLNKKLNKLSVNINNNNNNNNDISSISSSETMTLTSIPNSITPSVSLTPIINNNNIEQQYLSSIPQLSSNINSNISSSSNLSSNNNNSISIQLPYQNEYPKLFKATKSRQLNMLHKHYIVEIINETKTETSSLIPVTTSNSEVYYYNIYSNDISAELKQLLLLSPNINIQSNHEICQMSKTDCIETVLETRTFVNGNQITTMKSYLNITDETGKQTQSELVSN